VRHCIFCDGRVDSREDIWPKWILERLRIKGPITADIPKYKSWLIHDPKDGHKSRCVCRGCNNGWMSDLEVGNKPLIGCLLQDIATPLDQSQQKALATWALKTAMVTESLARAQRGYFYTRTERHDLRTKLSLPPRTSVWLARYSGSGAIAMKGTDAWSANDAPIPIHGYVYTILLGNLVIQSMTVHAPSKYGDAAFNVSPKAGPWEAGLVRVWPPDGRDIRWPPPLTFRDGQPSIHALMNRFSIGVNRNA
jgi:hypothetical protein